MAYYDLPPSQSWQVKEVLRGFKPTYMPSPRHAVDVGVAVQNMMMATVAVDFYHVFISNRAGRFLAIEADCLLGADDPLLYGLAWDAAQECWLPAYRYLHEMDQHSYVMLPVYSKHGNGTATELIQVIDELKREGVDWI